MDESFYINILYVLIILFGSLTSIDDIRKKIISNKYIAWFSVVGIIINLYVILYFYSDYIQVAYYFLIVIVSLVIGFILYYNGFWSAGDGKLLITYSCLFPFVFLVNNNISILFFHIILLINVFVPYFLFSLIVANYNSVFANKKVVKMRDWMEIIDETIFVFVLIWCTNIVLISFSNYFGDFIVRFNFLIKLSFTSLFVFVLNSLSYKMNDNKIFKFFMKFKKSKDRNIKHTSREKKLNPFLKIFLDLKFKDIFLFVLLVLSLYFQKESIFKISFWYEFIVIYVVLSLIKRYMKNRVIEFFSKKTDVLKLKKGMILRDYIIVGEGTMNTSETRKESFDVPENSVIVKEKASKSDIVAFHGVLSSSDVFFINKLYKNKSLTFNKVEIHTMMPFAPLVFLGVILFILLKGISLSFFVI